MSVAVIIPVYTYSYIANVINDLKPERDYIDLYVVDNGLQWDWPPDDSWIELVRPKANLRWTKGTNLGWRIAASRKAYGGYLLLNDDTRLSREFVAGLVDASESAPAGLVAPVYDDVWQHQRASYQGPAAGYRPSPVSKPSSFVDFTGVYITDPCFRSVGYLDDINFGETGWGADFDYCLRANQLGFNIIVTEFSYMNHFHQGTAKLLGLDWNALAGSELNTGMRHKWGDGWQEKVGIY